MAFIPQRPQAWHGSLKDNLQYAATFTGLKGESNYLWTEMVMARMGLRPFRTFSWKRISSGYKMRFELARILICKPEVLLLDEPLANLDMLAQQVILEDLRFLAQSHARPLSIMLSSQQLYEVEKVSDMVVFLNKGFPKYQQLGQPIVASEEREVVFEIETQASREFLQEALSPIGLQKISFNGGVYILHFSGNTNSGKVLEALSRDEVRLKYFRDISDSSRRFFIS
jgi:ABC-2 type transport system ATP-binding protein